MIAKDMQPFSVVSDVGFKDLLYALDTRYKIPSEFAVKETLLPQIYSEIKTKL
jgi:hypothetical protein